LLVEKTGSFNWISLFTYYDKTKDNLLDKQEIKAMLKDSGYVDVTDAEAAFAFNVIANFTNKFINKKVYMDWI